MKKADPKPDKKEHLFEGNEPARIKAEKYINDIFNLAITCVLSIIIFFTLSTVPGLGSIFFVIGFLGFTCSTIYCAKRIIQYKQLINKLTEDYELKMAKEAQEAQRAQQAQESQENDIN